MIDGTLPDDLIIQGDLAVPQNASWIVLLAVDGTNLKLVLMVQFGFLK